MTTLAVPVLLKGDQSLQPVPWRRMVWVTWRQHRVAMTGVAALLGALSVCLWILGLQLHHAYAAAIACHPTSSPACSGLVSRFNGMNGFLANGSVLQAVPPLIGAFVGATVLARELETGSFRYAWTQGFGRWRWALAKLVLLGVAVAVLAGAFSVLISWYYQPYFAAGNQALSLSSASPLSSGLFDLRGIAFASWTLIAFAIGGLAGMLIRRVVPAIVTTLVGYAGLAVAAGAFLRQHYLAPLVTAGLNVPGSAWILTQWGAMRGRFAFAWPPPLSLLQRVCPGPPPAHGGKVETIMGCLSQHGYTIWTRYQPDGRFWPFQWIEGGWLLALSVLLVVATVWLVRRRAT